MQEQEKLSVRTPAGLLQQIAAFSAHFGKYRRWVSVNLAENFAEIGENMRRFQAGFPEQVGILAQNGWFISLDTPLAAIYPVADLFRAGNVTEGHKQMCGHFSRIRQDIEDNLTTSFPERRRILQKAFRAHDAGDYELSVPVFLAQADGIAKKILGVSIYSRKSAVVRRMGDVIANIAAEELEDSLLRVVLKALPLTASTGSGAQGAGELNRHEVLHGIDTQYATELNSYRAISWLQCAAHFDEAKKCSNRRSQKVGQADVPKP